MSQQRPAGDAKGAAKDGEGGDTSKYFATTKKGEIGELKQDLNSFKPEKIKEAVKKTIAAMTVGKDVGALFTDIVKSMQTENIELKKLIYLYLINYARHQPDKAILIVNTFQKDCSHTSPLVRALAIRTMGCIRVDRITEYLCEPLGKCLKDKDPYVRKTAAICVTKLYDISKELVEEQGFLDILRDMISDPNPMVVANAVAALAEIAEASGRDVFQINSAILAKLMAALNECTEWGQVFILDCLSRYEPDTKEAEDIIDRVSPRLKHANAAVAMSAVKVIMRYLSKVTNADLERKIITEKLPPPLITLLSEHKPEIQYVALRNINLITQRRPDILSASVKHFFCKYNDPIYVKMEKLEVMIKLASVKNIEKVLMEFKEYASEVDVEFVRKAVLAIGRCAIKLDKAAERCIKVLLELIQTKVNYVVQEAIIVIKDIFRKYPNRYESIIATLCENLDTLDEPEAKASMIWIIGEYADRIDNAPELLDAFVDQFEDEQPTVQLQLLTAVVKLFLKRPEAAKTMVTNVLNLATDHSDNPDLRDRGYVYWRLLSTDPEAAQSVVLAQKPVISDDDFNLDPSVLDILINNLSTLASIYHKPPEFFIKDGKPTLTLKANDQKTAKKRSEDDDDSDSEGSESGEEEEEGAARPVDSENIEGDDDEAEEKKGPASPPPHSQQQQPQQQRKPAANVLDVDLLGLGALDTPAPQPVHQSAPAQTSGGGGGGGGGGMFGFDDFDTPTPQPTNPAMRVLLTVEAGKGLQISGTWVRRSGQAWLDMFIENKSQTTLAIFQIKFNNNFAGVTPAAPMKVSPIAPGGNASCQLPVVDNKAAQGAYGVIQMAIKTELGVAYFQDKLNAALLFTEDGLLDKKAFLQMWGAIPDSMEQKGVVANRRYATSDQVKDRLARFNVFYIATRKVPERGEVTYLSIKYKGLVLMAEITVRGDFCEACVKSEDQTQSQTTLQAIVETLTT